MYKNIFCLIIAFCILCPFPSALADDIYYYLPFEKLEITNGIWPDGSQVEISVLEKNFSRRKKVINFMHPYAVGNANEEIYLLKKSSPEISPSWAVLRPSLDDYFIALRAQKGTIPSGFLFVPRADWSGMTRLDFSLSTAHPNQNEARQKFLQAKERHYQRLFNLNIPGAAWFRHQMRQARSELDPNSLKDSFDPDSSPQRRDRPPRSSELERTYSLFSGGRALSENLQLDRQLRPENSSVHTVPLDTIAGITIADIDWTEITQDLKPAKDFLADFIPADQHVIFFPSFASLVTLADEADEHGTPVLQLLEPRSEDALTRPRYEQQLCLSLDTLTRLLGNKLVISVAFTGSDPYLRTGSDVALLFEAANPQALKTTITARQSAASSNPEVKTVSGNMQNIPYTGVISPDRSVCSYLASIDRMVVVTNSLYQLQRVIQAAKKDIPNISSLEEYTFFRSRYPLNDPKETALLILTDATIRRWCGPRWRIAASRRTRAASLLAELQARHLDELVKGNIKSKTLIKNQSLVDLGDLTIYERSVASSIYGTTSFLIPIAEIPLDKVSPEEQQAYQQFRDSYQRRWRKFFDPVALRFTVRPESIAIDLTVRPLIADSDYREFIQLADNAEITAQAGDPHPESLLHFVMSINRNSELVRELTSFTNQMVPGSDLNSLNWLGSWLTLYADDNPFWDDLSQAVSNGGMMAAPRFLEKNYHKLPVVLHIDSGNPLKLTAFLVALRAFVEQTSPGLTVWQTLQHHDRPYVKISTSSQAQADMVDNELKNFALYYAATSNALVVTLNENLLKKSLDRMTARSQAKAQKKESNSSSVPWLGKSLALQVKQSALDIVQTMFQENLNANLEQRSWANIPILNEWNRRYPRTSPEILHQRLWNTRLVCPGGGKYTWNEKFQTFESTAFGHPARPRFRHDLSISWFDITLANLGITFENNGLRAQAELTRQKKSN
jgi:hypothetical protein